MDINTVISMSKWAKRVQGNKLTMTLECLRTSASFAEKLGVKDPAVIAHLYDGIMDDDANSWTEEQFANWVICFCISFPNFSENTLMEIYINMSKVMGDVADKYFSASALN